MTLVPRPPEGGGACAPTPWHPPTEVPMGGAEPPGHGWGLVALHRCSLGRPAWWHPCPVAPLHAGAPIMVDRCLMRFSGASPQGGMLASELRWLQATCEGVWAPTPYLRCEGPWIGHPGPLTHGAHLPSPGLPWSGRPWTATRVTPLRIWLKCAKRASFSLHGSGAAWWYPPSLLVY